MNLTKKQKIIIAIVIIVLLILFIWFYFVGENFKSILIYERMEEGTEQLDAVPAFALVTYVHQDGNFSAEERQKFIDICTSDYIECIDKYAPNESLKTKCKQATIDITNFLSNVRNENSVFLGFKLTIKALVCPTNQEQFAGIIIPSKRTEEEKECILKIGVDYGSSAAMNSLDACVQEFNALRNEE